MIKLWLLLFGFFAASNANAVGMTIAMAITGATLATAGIGTLAIAFAINMVVSAVISKAFFTPSQPDGGMGSGSSIDPGNRQQLPPATDNKLPVVYGSAWVGGIVTDLSISSDNQQMYYVIALSEVTSTNDGETPDEITFGDIYWGGKRVVFDSTDEYKVTGLVDESTLVTDNAVAGKMEIYLYNNGSNSPVNSSKTAIQVMQTDGLIYKWDSYKLMSNCAFAIVHLTYSQNANIRGLEQTKFNVINARHKTGDVIYDYLVNTRYGGALPPAQINTDSLDELNAYGDELFTYQTYEGSVATQTRFRFDGTVDTKRTIMANLQDMASSCDCLIKYNEITATWGVIVQKPTYDVAMHIDDSNIVSAIQVTPIDIAGSYNVAEVKFPDKGNQDAFNSVTYDLAEIDPALLFPNEPVNKQSIALPFVNDNVRAQYLGTRFLKSAREDLQIQCSIGFTGLQLEAGDILTMTNANYGWTDKLFRITKCTETFGDDGSVTVNLLLSEFNPSVYDDANITQFTPAPNSGIGSPLGFGSLYAPTIANIQTIAPAPSFEVLVTASSAGIVQYAEVYYSAYQYPTDAQRIFVGTTIVNPSGTPFSPNTSMGAVTIANIPQGDWYFAVRMVNSYGASLFSASSAVLQWRPMTFQFTQRYLALAYADNATGTSGFSYDPRGKSYFGIFNNDTANGGTTASIYTWYQASENFSTNNYVLYANRSNRKFSLAVGAAGYFNLGGAFVPQDTAKYDSKVWSAMNDPTGGKQSFIDLDAATGQNVLAGATGNNQNDGFLAVTNNTDGTMKVNLQNFLNFGAGIYTKSFNAATLTIDIYGRVVGFTEQDEFFYTETVYTATAGQTSFSNTHTVGWVLVFRNGILLDPSEYSETSSTVVMNNACASGEIVVIIYMKGVSTSANYEALNITIASSTSNSITYANAPWDIINAGDSLTFSDSGTPTAYVVQSINTSTKVITFTSSISGATAGNAVYRYRAAGSSYAPFSRYDQDVTAIDSFTPTAYSLRSGFESIYVNGSQISEVDYNLNSNTIDGFPAQVTGRMTIIQYTPNNLDVPASNIANTPAYSTAGQLTYPFPNNPLSFELYANGVLMIQGSGKDFTATSSNFTLTTAFNNGSTLLNQQTFGRTGAA